MGRNQCRKKFRVKDMLFACPSITELSLRFRKKTTQKQENGKHTVIIHITLNYQG